MRAEFLKVCLMAYVIADGFVEGMRTGYVNLIVFYIWTLGLDNVEEIL